jgi:cell wall-associated NlpC family hydrolase
LSSARAVLRILSPQDGIADATHRRRQYRTVAAGAAGVVGLVLLVVSFGTMSISYHSKAASPDSQAGSASHTTPHDRGAARLSGVRLVRTAAQERGKPYKYGADGPRSFDCSGFTKYVYAQFGVKLPHNAAAQYRAVDHVAKADKRRGDLLFFRDKHGVYHVGIYAGDKQMWAAANPREDVRKQHIWTDRYVVGRPGARAG